MDTQESEKINKLAISLKENNLAANMEEAVEKAKEMLEMEVHTDNENKDKPINIESPEKDLKTVNELFENEEKSNELAEKSLDETEEIEKQLEEVEKKEKSVEKEITDLDKDIKEIEEDVSELKSE